MNKIAFPLKPRMNGPKVGDLQAALQLLLERAVILANDEGARREWSTALKRERVEQIYGDATGKLVSSFRHQQCQDLSRRFMTSLPNLTLIHEWFVDRCATQTLTLNKWLSVIC